MAKQKTKSKKITKKNNSPYKAEHLDKIQDFTNALKYVLSDLVVEATFFDFDITDPSEFTDQTAKEIVFNAILRLAPELLNDKDQYANL